MFLVLEILGGVSQGSSHDRHVLNSFKVNSMVANPGKFQMLVASKLITAR